MPIYEYNCDECDNRYDALVRSSTVEADISCPDCGSRSKTKQLSVFSAAVAGKPSKAAGSCGSGCGCSGGCSGNCSGCRCH